MQYRVQIQSQYRVTEYGFFITHKKLLRGHGAVLRSLPETSEQVRALTPLIDKNFVFHSEEFFFINYINKLPL
jgi:hypothetical protein